MSDISYPKKVFILGPNDNTILANEKENAAFVGDRVNKLISARNDPVAFRSAMESLFTELISVYEFDKKTAVLPDPLGSFESEEDKQTWIERHLLAIEFDCHLGCILYNYHEWLVNNAGLPDVLLGRMVTDYPSVYERALYDYISVLTNRPPQYPFQLAFHADNAEDAAARDALKASMQRGQLYGANKPYFASFALPSLIEHYLIGFTQQNLVEKLLRELTGKVERGETSLTKDDLRFVNMILSKQHIMPGNREDAMRRCRIILENKGMIPDKATGEIVLGAKGKSPITLGQFLKNPYAKDHIKKPYYDVLDMLFLTDKVNLRNSIMHGASTTTDPYAMCFAAVMLEIFWAVIEESIYSN